jgi:hypothetical protein
MYQYQKVSAQLVPKCLTDKNKLERLKCCLMAMTQYTAEHKGFLNKGITSDKSWINHCISESKQASMEWKHATSPTKMKFKARPTTRKVMLTVSWEHVLLISWDIVNSDSYSATLAKLKQQIKRIKPSIHT